MSERLLRQLGRCGPLRDFGNREDTLWRDAEPEQFAAAATRRVHLAAAHELVQSVKGNR
jgi:hypothetical protein